MLSSHLPKVSIITPTYNSAEVIEVCLQSVAQQNYMNKEHLILDAQSKDDTLNIVREYQHSYPHIKLISEPDKGIWDAMNKGIALSEGEWVYFMGSDDALHNENVLTKIFGTGEGNNYDIIYGNVQHRNTGKQFNDEFDTKLLARFNIAHQAIFYRKTVFETTGNYSLKYFSGSDYAVNIQWFGNKKIRRKYVEDVICIYNEAGLSSVFFDRPFHRDKLNMLLKNLEFDKPEHLTDAGRHIIYNQLKNNDIIGALANLRILFKHAGPGFDKRLFIKEFLALIFKKSDALAGQKFKGRV